MLCTGLTAVLTKLLAEGWCINEERGGSDARGEGKTRKGRQGVGRVGRVTQGQDGVVWLLKPIQHLISHWQCWPIDLVLKYPVPGLKPMYLSCSFRHMP